MSSGYDYHNMPFVDVKVDEIFQHISDKEDEEGMKDDKAITEFPCIDIECNHHFTDIDTCEKFPSMLKNLSFQNLCNASINLFSIVPHYIIAAMSNVIITGPHPYTIQDMMVMVWRSLSHRSPPFSTVPYRSREGRGSNVSCTCPKRWNGMGPYYTRNCI